MKYLLDTNICIYLLNNKSELLRKAFRKHDPSDIFISSITYSELLYGVEKSKQKERNRINLAMLVSVTKVLDYDEFGADAYGKIRADLESRGQTIGPLDMLIAGHALSRGFTLVTNNTKEFKRINNLLVEDWTIKEA